MILCSLPGENLCQTEQENILIVLIYQLSRGILSCEIVEETLHDQCRLNMVSDHSINFLIGSKSYLYIDPWRKGKARAANRGWIFIYAICSVNSDLELLPFMQLPYGRSSGNAISGYLHTSPEILQRGIGFSEIRVEYWIQKWEQVVQGLFIVGYCTAIHLQSWSCSYKRWL